MRRLNPLEKLYVRNVGATVMTEAVAEMTVTETTCQHRESAGHDSCLRQVPIFNELSEPEISVLTKAIHSRRYRKGQFVFEAEIGRAHV